MVKTVVREIACERKDYRAIKTLTACEIVYVKGE